MPQRAASIVGQARKSGRGVLSATDVYTIFEAYGIPVAGWKVVDTAAAAVAAADAIGYPVVVKVDSEAIDHKSDMGGVAVNLKDAAAVRAAVEGTQGRLGTSGTLRFLVQKFLPGGGADRRRQRLAGARPSRDVRARRDLRRGAEGRGLQDRAGHPGGGREMLASIKTKALLDGMRGEKGIDKEKVIDLILRVSQAPHRPPDDPGDGPKPDPCLRARGVRG